MSRSERDPLSTLGNILVWLGVAVWVVYAVQRWGLDREVSVGNFLPYHLAGVIPGFLLRHRRFIARLFRK